MNQASCLRDGTLLQGNKYRIVRFLGAGGFGCTYEAVFETLGERVAIKEFFPHEFCNRDATGTMSVGTDSRVEFVERLRRKFVDEARTLFRFKGLDGVVNVTDVFEENGTSYYVMDYVDGRSLRKVITADGLLPEADALRLIREVGHALQGVHERNCLHLDIKPDNIMLGADGHPILIDFGVSKQYTREDGCNTSTLMGCTPGYAPLEQMKGNVRAFLPATDIYALGATLYALVTGQTPPDATDLLNDDESLQYPDSVSPQTRAAIEAAMNPKVKDRPQTVAAFLALLPGAEQKPSSQPAGTQTFGPQPDPHPGTQIMADKPAGKSTKKYLWIAIAAAIAAIIAVVAWQWPTTPTPDLVAADTTKVDTVAVVQTAIANAATKPQAAEPEKPEPKPETQPEPVKPETPAKTEQPAQPESAKPEPVTPAKVEPQQQGAPASSRTTETAMVAAYTDGGEYRAYTLADWDGFTAEQRAKVTPVGVQLSASGQKFIVAPTDAGNGAKYKWEDKDSYKDCVEIPGLRNVNHEEEAKRDFNGRSNTNALLAYGREHGINYPATKAAANYSFKGLSGWYLPASGQLWLMDENKEAINRLLGKIGGTSLSYYWSSTEYSASSAWLVSMNYGLIGNHAKNNSGRVRAVAPVSLPSSAK